jgi:hypothetical protein
MQADGQEAAPQLSITAEAEDQMIAHEQPSAMEQEPTFEPPVAPPSEEVVGGIKEDVADTAQADSAGPSAAAGGRKRKSVTVKDEGSEGTPTARRGRSSVGDAADSPAGSSAKKAKGSAKSAQVLLQSFKVVQLEVL